MARDPWHGGSPHPPRQTEPLQALHRLAGPRRQIVECLRRDAQVGDRHAPTLQREPSQPADRGALVPGRIPAPQHQADPQRVGKAYLWKLTGPARTRLGLPVSRERRKRTYGVPASPIRTYVRILVKLGVSARSTANAAAAAGVGLGLIVWSMVALDRVQERRRGVALARHYRDEEGLSVGEIARRLGRAPATVKAYLYDASERNKRPRCS